MSKSSLFKKKSTLLAFVAYDSVNGCVAVAPGTIEQPVSRLAAARVAASITHRVRLIAVPSQAPLRLTPIRRADHQGVPEGVTEALVVPDCGKGDPTDWIRVEGAPGESVSKPSDPPPPITDAEGAVRDSIGTTNTAAATTASTRTTRAITSADFVVRGAGGAATGAGVATGAAGGGETAGADGCGASGATGVPQPSQKRSSSLSCLPHFTQYIAGPPRLTPAAPAPRCSRAYPS